MDVRFTFRRHQRLRQQRDFERVFAERCSVGDHLLVLYVARNELVHSRLGIKTGRRLGAAVVRSRVRRRIREAFRTCQHELPKGLDLVCIPRAPAATEAGAADFAHSLQTLIARAARKLPSQSDADSVE